MITEQHTCEALSRAHLLTVAARAGANLECRPAMGDREFDYGVDGTFHSIQIIGGRRAESGFALDFQLKASTRWRSKKDGIVYDLEAAAYNDLARRAAATGSTPIILLLLCLPEDRQQWVTVSDKELILRKCCYWHVISGETSENVSRVRITIPREQLLTPEALGSLIDRVTNGGFYEPVA